MSIIQGIRMRFLSRFAVAAALALLLAGCGSKITESNFAKIHQGMTREQVVDVLGKPTNSSTMHVLGLSGTSATWTDKHARITIQFVDGKVRMKSFDDNREDR